MADIIDLSKAREDRTPHMSGRVRCLDCKHEWQGVAPTGTTWMECPACSLTRGRFVAQCEMDMPHWHCTCGNDLFYITEDRAYCPNCGTEQVF